MFVPRAVPLWVSCSTNHADAVKFIQVPIADTVWPNRYSRKLRELLTEDSVRPRASVILVLIRVAP